MEIKCLDLTKSCANDVIIAPYVAQFWTKST